MGRPSLPVAAVALLAALLARPPTSIHLPGSPLPLASPPPASVPRPRALPTPPRDVLAGAAAVVPGTEDVVGCETPAVGEDGTLFLPDARGRVWRLPPGAAAPTLLATLPGRPLGAAVAPDGDVIVACAAAGVFAVHPATGAARLLAAASDDGAPILFADGVFPTADGAVLVTDAMGAPPPPPVRAGAPWRALEGSAAALFSGLPSGRLLRCDARTGATTVLASGLWFPNGVVALGGGGGDAVVSETHGARLLRVDGATGAVAPFGPPLPGFPDGLALTGDGKHILVAIYAVPADPKGLAVLAASPRLRSLVHRLPQALIDKSNPPVGLVLTVDASSGDIVDAVADGSGKVVSAVTAAVPDGRGGLLLGSLTGAGVKRVVT